LHCQKLEPKTRGKIEEKYDDDDLTKPGIPGFVSDWCSSYTTTHIILIHEG
jgi:hypothetical protein